MTDLLLVRIDPHDDAAVDAWHAAYAAASRAGRDPAAANVWTLEETRADLQHPSVRRWSQAWSGLVGDQVVAAGVVLGSNLDNREQATLSVCTRPDRRGRGHGSAMLTRLEEVAHERGRRLFDGEIAWRWEADPTGTGVPDVDWARRRGYRVGLIDVQRQVRLPVDDALLDRLAAEAAPHHGDYTLRSFVGPVPDELLAGWATLSSSLMTEAPMGEIQREPAVVDLDAYRDGEAKVAAQGRTTINTVALTADGEAVAYTDIGISIHDPERAYQWGTLVRRDHRGHRLGMAVKLANLRQLQQHLRAELFGVSRLVTYNAEVNAHMIGVNEQLGFVPVERMGEVQKRLA